MFIFHTFINEVEKCYQNNNEIRLFETVIILIDYFEISHVRNKES